MNKNIFLKIISLLLLFSLIAGCGKSEAPAKKQLVLCSSMGRQLTELFAENYSKATGTKVKISYLPAGTQKERFDYLRQNKFDVWLGALMILCLKILTNFDKELNSIREN